MPDHTPHRASTALIFHSLCCRTLPGYLRVLRRSQLLTRVCLLAVGRGLAAIHLTTARNAVYIPRVLWWMARAHGGSCMSGPLSLLRHWSVFRYRRPRHEKMLWGLLALWVSLGLAPISVSSQTAPVTIGVTIGTPAPLGSSGGGSLAAASLSASGLTSGLVFNQLVLPEAQTTTEKTSAQEGTVPGLLQRPRTVGGMFRYEHIHLHQGTLDLDGNSYATNLQLAWDLDRVSFGVLLSYDFLALTSFDAHIVGLVPYVQYHLPVSAIYTVALTVNGNYAYTALNEHFGDWNTYGGGVSLSVTRDHDILVVRGALSYQYNQDDTANTNDHQHLLKFGTDVGVRIGREAIVTLFGVWNYDPTAYKNVVHPSKNNYVDLGLEGGVSLSKTWKLTGGYKTVLGLTHFDSHQVFVGSLFRF